jgi:hypothetical protein
LFHFAQPCLFGTESSLSFVNRGCYLKFKKDSDGNQPLLTNDGTVDLNSNNAQILLSSGVEATLAGSGTVWMKGDSYIHVAGEGNKLINEEDHTIRGVGTIYGPMVNKGSVVADGGKLHLHFKGTTLENQGILTTVGSGSTLRLQEVFLTSGQLNPMGDRWNCQTLS